MLHADEDAESGDAAPAQAEAWLNHLLSGEMTAVDACAFKAWRRSDPANAQAFAEMVRLRRLVQAAVRTAR